jgi:predicted metal-dependent phosphoesterase TrpH
MLRVDFHLHTVYSNDSTISPRLLVEQLHNHAAIKGVAVTDHNTLEGYHQVRKMASVYEDLVVLPGVEVSTDKGDLILLGVDDAPKLPSTLDSTLDFARARDGIMVVPHPYRFLGLGDLTMDVEAHAIEVLNPTAKSGENMLAHRATEARRLPGIAGTDAHRPEELWTTFTEVDVSPDPESILTAFRKRSVESFTVRRSRSAEKLEGGKVASRN